ncbi:MULTISPECIES: porin [unclassified Halomonas]|uniref:porin n=1 Tax=unclassified Halomonas TaxID=2609666 RepID=UPI0028884439|nr:MULTISPECIES: porin [unclassified Halomonas]MDT0501509.1 porin [Halomonas sp. PAR7]MDT0512809.1 porin [Halomonas sp. LES1]MDT0591366.1 porin [Halomonas sp. PAR8]
MQQHTHLWLAPLSCVILLAGPAQAQESHSGPNFKGELATGALKVDDRDIDAWAFGLEAGFDGLFTFDDTPLKLSYDFVADFTNAVNDNDALTWTPGNPNGGTDDDIYIRTARLLLISDYGSLLFAPRIPSGQWNALYSEIDNYYYNRFHAQTGDIAIFGQVEQASDVIAYVSPTFGGGFRFVGTSLTLDDANNKDSDVWAARLVYNNAEGLKAGIGHVITNAEQLPTDDDYHRSVASLSHELGRLDLAGIYEINRDHPTGDFDSYGTNVTYDLTNRWTTSLGYAEKRHDDNEALNERVVVADIKYHLGENTTLFLETGQYEEAHDNIAGGISMKF